MAGLAQLLAFADAVGSSRGLLLAFDADAMDLTADVQLSSKTPVEPTTAQLQMGRGHRFVPGKRWAVSLMGFTPSTGDMTAIKDVGADRAAVQQQVAEQIEALLCLAYKLKLPVLKGSLCRVVACDSSQSVSGGSPFLDAKTLQTIMSNSLMAAAGCSNRDDMLKALFPQQLANVLHPMGGVTPVPAGGMASNYYEYSAQVAEDFMYYKKGDKVVVKMQHFLSPSFELWLDRLGTGTPHMTSYSHTVNVRHVMVPPGTMHI